MASLDDFRQLPQYKDFSDEQLVVTLSQKYGIEPGEIAQEFGVSYNPQRNPLGAGLSAGVDQLQGLGYGAIGAGARALGAEGVADWTDRGVERNYAESAFNGRSDLERIEDQSLGSALPFLGYQVAKQVPMLAGTLAASAAVPQAAIPAALSRGLAVIPKGLGGGGLKAGMDFAGRRAALEAGNAFGRTIAASYPIGVGAMYGEAVERGDPSQGDALAALGLGVPYGAAEAVMPSMVRNAFGSNAARFAGGLPTRLAKAGGLGFAGEAGTELFQNELEMGFAGDLTQDEIDSRRLNSAVIGGLVGGTFNLPAGFRGQRNPADPIDILNRDTSPQPDATPQFGQSELNFGITGEEAIGTRGLRNPFDAAGYVSGFQQGQETTVDVPQSDLFGGVNEMPPVDVPRTPKIDIPVPQPLQSDPVRSAVAQASPATLRKDGSLKDIVEKALGAYSKFSDGEIAAALEEFAASKRKDTVWRVAALEAIARQRAAQGAPNVAQVDAASGQGAGAVPAGSAGNTPSGPVVLDGVRQPAGAPAPGSAARVPVGEPVVQQPSGLTQGAQPANVPPTQQVAPQAQEARGQESAQAGAEQFREPVVTAEELRIAQKRDADPTAPGAVRVISSDGVERWVTPTKAKTAAKGKRAAGERVPFEQLRGTEQQMVRDFMGYDEFGEVSEEVEPMSLRQMSSVYGVSHETIGKRLAELGYTNEAREQESAAEEVFLTETVIGREDASPEMSDEAIDIADVVGGNLRVQKGVGAKGDTGAGRGYQKLLAAGTRFDARRDGRPIWSEAAIAEAVASNALSDEQLVAAEKELAARAKREADERAAKQSKRGERAAPAPRTQEQIAKEGRAVSRAQNQAERDARVRAEREAAEQEVQRRVAAEAALQREYATLLAMPDARKAASYWNRFADEGAPSFDELPQELQVEWVERYTDLLAELPADARVPDAMEALQSATQQEFLNDETYQRAVGAVGETVAGGDSTGSQNQGAEEGNRPDEVARADAREEVTSTNPLEARVAALRDLDLGEKQTARLDKLVRRYQNREIDTERLGEELQMLGEQAFPEDKGGKGMRFSRTEDRPAKVWFSGDRGTAGNGDVLAGLSRVDDDSDLLFEDPDLEGAVYITGMELQRDGRQGRASDVLRAITAWADASGETLALTPAASGRLNQEGLIAWYARNGFERRASGVMVRRPQVRRSAGADTQGTTVEAVRSAINAIATPMGRRKVTVYQTADEAVQNGALSSKDATGTQGWVDAKGNAFFIAGNIPNGSELAVVLHEIGAHLGIEKLLTDAQYKALVKKIFDWAQSDANTQEARIARAALARVDSAKLENEADLAPETIAYFVEEAVKAGVNPTAMQYKTELGRWFRTLWAAFKVALRRLNLINADRLTAQNVVDLAYGAARIELASTYHGTAANFRRFDHRFMGSGEGAQAFGWGTYLAQRFGIANEYFKADVRRKGDEIQEINIDAIDKKLQSEIPQSLRDGLVELMRVVEMFGTGDPGYVFSRAGQRLLDDGNTKAYNFLQQQYYQLVRRTRERPEGNIHVVDVNFTEDEMLDWDRPLSEQSPQVRAAVYETGMPERADPDFDYDQMTGEEIYLDLASAMGSDKAASEYLDSLGIKGIKFLDAKSRGQKRDIVDKTGAPVPTPTRPTPGVRSALTFVTGFDSMADALAEARKQAETYPSMSEMVDVLAYWVGKGYQLKAADQTRNLVVFNDRNIYRVGSMRGGPVGKGGRMMFSKAADPQLTELAQESGHRAWAAIRAGVRKGWTGLAFSSHLASAAHRAGLTSARALELVQRKKATRAYEIQIEVEKVLSKFADLKGQINGRPTSEVVQRFIYDSTFDKKWGFKPDWKQDAVVDPEMERRFNALPTEAQTVIKDVFRHGDAIFKEKQDLLRKTITGEYEALIKAETDDGKRRKLERQRDKELREAGRLIAEMNGPYAPLRRYGDYVVVAKSQKYRDAEAAGSVDAKLKRDENHYVVEFAETLYEAERLQGVLEGKFGKGLVWAGEKETATEQFGELPFMAVQRLRKMVDTDLDGELNTKSKRVLNKLLVDLYISTLHEANARHSEQKRQFVNRADRDTAAKDMMRAFATQGRADSHLVSALQFNSEIVDEMQKLRNEAKNGQGDSLLKTRLRNEILQRHMMDLDFRETPVQDKLMSLNSFWMLLTSPGYYVQNATQVMMMTQPVLAGKFGQNRSMRQLMRGYQDAMRVLKGSSWNEAADLSRFNGTADEKAMLVELQARGTLDFGISAELGYWESRGEISKVFNQVMRKVGMGTRKLEVLNRMSSALAAYRLMYDQTTGTQAKRHAAALDYADSIIKDTHGDYSSTNAPRYLRMMPKVMTQFRKFQLIQLSLFAKVIHGSIKGANPQEKRAMRAALGYLFMNHALLAGAVGIPASALLGAIYAIAGDDDDPNDWEVDVRRAIGDKEMADLILHGLPSLININMSNKIGAGTMLDPLPFVEYEATRGGYEKAVTAAMGPLIGGLGAQVVDAFGRILKGDVAQGTAQLLPLGFRDAARGFMAAQDGIQLRNGQTALTPEELSFYDSLMMGLGLPTLKTTSRTETQFKSQQYEQFFRERVTKLKRQYSEAYEENDRQAMLEARQAWAEMQASRKNLGFKVQPLSELLKAPREKAKAEAKLQGGVRTTEQARGFVQSLQ